MAQKAYNRRRIPQSVLVALAKLVDSLRLLLAIEHTTRVAFQAKTRRELAVVPIHASRAEA